MTFDQIEPQAEQRSSWLKSMHPRNSLVAQISYAMAVMSIVLSVALSYYAGNLSRHQLEHELGQSFARRSQSIVDALDRGKFERYREVQIVASLDDFGTGYSSLSRLKTLPLDYLKIDQSFVRDLATDPNDAAIVRAILSMSREMDLKVIAEGVETTEQLEFLRSLECLTFQGYLFSRPVPPEEIELHLKKA